MFKGFALLRQSLTAVVFLRRISRELRRANDLAEARLALEYPQWYKSSNLARTQARNPTVLGRPTRLSDLGTPTVDNWNKDYLERHPPQHETDEESEYDIT